MKIVDVSREFSKVEEYLMTSDKGCRNMKDIEDGEVIPFHGYLIYEDVNSKGEEVNIMSVLSDNGMVLCTQSETFKNSIRGMVEAFGNDFSFVKTSGVTKSDRPYIDCRLDFTSVK